MGKDMKNRLQNVQSGVDGGNTVQTENKSPVVPDPVTLKNQVQLVTSKPGNELELMVRLIAQMNTNIVAVHEELKKLNIHFDQVGKS